MMVCSELFAYLIYFDQDHVKFSILLIIMNYLYTYVYILYLNEPLELMIANTSQYKYCKYIYLQ